MTLSAIRRRAGRRQLHAAAGGRCFYCGSHLAWECAPKQGGRDWLIVAVSTAMDVEHKDPVIRGGAHSFDNAVASCKRCNSAKRMRTLEEYRLHVGLHQGRLPYCFAGEAPPMARDFLVVVTGPAIARLVHHNFPQSRLTRQQQNTRRWDAHAVRKTALK